MASNEMNLREIHNKYHKTNLRE